MKLMLMYNIPHIRCDFTMNHDTVLLKYFGFFVLYNFDVFDVILECYILFLSFFILMNYFKDDIYFALQLFAKA